MRFWLFVVLGAVLGSSVPALAQQSDGSVTAEPAFKGRVTASPVPRIRVIRPDDPADAADTNATDTNAAQTPAPQDDDASQAQSGDGTVAQPQAGDGTAEQPRQTPRVIRLGEGQDKPEDQAENKTPGDGTWKDDRSSRFKKAPESTSRDTYDPEAPPPIVPIRTPRTRLKPGARLRQLDKMTGQIQTYDVTVGEAVQVARLRIRLDACRAPGDNDTHGTMAFVKIWDMKRANDGPAFSGWMFAESPALSALDHPRYDVWVINCTTPLAE